MDKTEKNKILVLIIIITTENLKQIATQNNILVVVLVIIVTIVMQLILVQGSLGGHNQDQDWAGNIFYKYRTLRRPELCSNTTPKPQALKP